jgi:hypothetical protein
MVIIKIDHLEPKSLGVRGLVEGEGIIYLQ